jgi:RNA polymerase sigma factor (sigma-70 family)
VEQIIGPGDERRSALPATAFEAFFVAQQRGALRLAWLLTHDRNRTDDLVQDAFTAVMVRFDELEHPAAYFRTTLVNLVHERHRRSDREEKRVRLESASRSLAVSAPVDPMIDVVAVLPLAQRTAVVLRYWCDLPDEEIAATLAVRPATVRSLIHRAMKHLAKEIER